jgi:hypothetical protein
MPSRVGLNEDRSLLAPDLRIVGVLETAQPRVVDSHVPEEVRGELFVRIETPALLDEADPVEVEGGDAACLIRRHLPADVRKGLLLAEAIDEELAVLVGAVFECFAQLRDGGARIADFRRDRVNRVGVDARREDAAAAVDDVAAHRRGVDGPHVLLLGARREIGVPHHLQVDEPRLDPRHPERETRGGGGDAPLQCGAPDVRAGRAGCGQ